MKNILLRPLSFIFLLMLSVTTVFAQERMEVKGIVTGDDGEPLIGVTVLIDGRTGAGTITGVNGDYTISVEKGAKLSYHFVGMETKKVTANKSKIDVKMTGDGILLEDVISIGFGTAQKKELTGAAAQVKAEELEQVVNTDVSQALQGLVSGVSVSASSGDPGSVANVQIRGITSLNGSNSPLYVVDGIPQQGNPELSTNEIATMDILKDAASCAIYGTEGAAGVILITTKQGEAGKMRFTFDAVYGFQSIAWDKLPELFTSSELAYSEMLAATDQGESASDSKLNIKKQDSFYSNDTNVMDMVMVEGLRPEQSYSFTMQGGMNEFTYSIVLGYANTAGLVKNSGFEKYNLRSNINYKRNKVKYVNSISYMQSETQSASTGTFKTVLNFKPYSPEVTRDMTDYVIPTEQANDSDAYTVAGMIRSFNTRSTSLKYSFSTNFGVDYSILPSLVLTGKASLAHNSAYTTKVTPDISIYNLLGETISDGSKNSSISNSASNSLSINWYAGLNYNQTFNKAHKVGGTFMASYSQSDSKGFSASKEGVIDNDLEVLAAATQDPAASSSAYSTTYLFGLIARGQYSYKSRYLLSASIRGDASSRFSADNRWGIFPSASAGWNISEEPFWEPLKKVWNGFKLRGSYGTTGNQRFGSYLYQTTMSTGADYAFGTENNSTVGYGVTQTAYSNPSIKWETSVQSNFGFDLAFFKNKFTISGDIYNTDKRDMLSNVTLPTSTGVSTSLTQNIGNMTNRGVELTLGYKGIVNGFNYSFSLNGAKNVNQITSLGTSDIIYSSQTVFAPGYEAGAFFLYKTNGVANTSEKLAAYKQIQPDAEMGDIILVDTDKDGKITISDRVYSGSGAAEFEGGFGVMLRWKGFDFSTRMHGCVGKEIINTPLQSSFSSNRNKLLIYQWSNSNPNSEIPRYYSSNFSSDYDLWVEDGSYFRLKTLTLGYTLPKSATEAMRIRSLRVFVTAQNPFTLTSYTGMDPEIGGNGLTTRGIDNGSYPVGKKVMFGAKLQF